MLIIAISSAVLWFVKPEHSYVNFALFWIVIGTMAVELSSVFYNAMLDQITPPNYIGRVSGWGWGTGYAGGLVALFLMLNLFILNDGARFGLDPKTAETIRICGPLVAVWLLIFSLPLFIVIKERPSQKVKMLQAVVEGLRSLGNTLRVMNRDYKNVFNFLIARMLYIDGLVTIFAFGGIYAAGVMHMSTIQIMEFGIGMNVAAGIGAAAFGWLDDARGPKLTILVALVLMIISGLSMLATHSILWFWIFGMGISLGFGPAQAAGRSLMIQISPPHLITEFFGLYNLSGRVTSFMGPWVLAWFTHWFQSQRVGMLTVFFFLFIGGLLLLRVKK